MRVHAGAEEQQPVATAFGRSSAYIAPSKAKSTSRKKHKPAATNLVVSPTVFCVLWWLIALYHLFNAMFILLVGAVQVFISQPAIYPSVWLIRIPQTTLTIAGWSFLAVAIAHLAALAINVYQSIKRRKLSFGGGSPELSPVQLLSQVSKASTLGGSTINLNERQRRFRLRELLPHVLWERYFGVRGLFGVEGKHFYAGFYARQVVEILMQTYQANQLSSSVPRVWINRLVVSMVVANCVYIPIVNVLMKQQPAARRITLLTIDLLIDFVIMVVVPIVVCLPHAFEFDWAASRFPDTYTYDDVWSTNIIAEVRQALVSTGVDYISTLAPHATGLGTLDTIKSLIHAVPLVQQEITSKPGDAAANRADIKPSEATATETHITTKPPRESESRRTPRRLMLAFYAFSLSWAGFVLIVHGLANANAKRTASLLGCSLHAGAWFATSATCSVVQINCYRHAIHGADADLTAILVQVERKSLKRMIFSHCPELHVPATLTEFPNLQFIEVHNSTLVAWPASAALTTKATPLVSQLNFVGSDFVTFPDGLLHDALPELLSLSIAKSNLSHIPDRFGDVWAGHTWPYFSVEFADVTSLPTSFPKLKCYRLSLTNLPLDVLPVDAFAGTEMTSIRFTNTSISALPPSIGATEELGQFMAQNTNLSSLPDWFDTWWRTRRSKGQVTQISLDGSPLCASAEYESICQPLEPSQAGDYRFELNRLYRPL